MRGYSELRAISPAELRALYPLACMRVCTTVVRATHSNPNLNLSNPNPNLTLIPGPN